MTDDEIRQEDDGTWTVDVGMDIKPVTGLPSKEVAISVRDAMWAMWERSYENASD